MGDTGKIEQLWLSDAMRVTSEELLEPWCVCRRCFDGCAAFLDECADYLVGMGKSSGSLTRKVLFSVNDTEGVVVQIRDVDASFSTEEVSLECGPDITISIRLLPKNNKLDVSMGRGQWLEELPNGILDWQSLRPLVTVEGGRRWRHRYAVSGLRDAAEAWLLHRSGAMPSMLNIFGEQGT